ncbi:MAG TPA: hypothetical protein VGT99_04090 [Gammaproteobacteria bacterium]|nr:hypothetical protein [Gammaproteobacteria bacterium]
MKILRLFVAVILLGVSSLAAADPQSYTNLELSFGRQGNIFLDGGTSYRFAGSYDLSDTFYTYGEYSSNTFGDFSNSQSGLDAKQSVFGIGLGMHFPVADASDWVVRFSINHNKAESAISTSTHTGYNLGTGFNTALSTGLELSTFIDHTTAGADTTTGLPANISASAGETVLSTGLHSQIGKNLDFGVTEEFSSIGQNRLLLSLRWDF